jgi:hypothetical protein
MSHPAEPDIVAIPWCREKDYDAFRGMFVDPHNLKPTWEEFVALAEETEKFQKAQGCVVERVYIDPREFREWCQLHQCRIDSNALRRFAHEVAVSRHARRGKP